MSDMEHLFIGDLRKNPDAEVRLLVDGRLVCGTWPRQVTQSIDAMIREARAVALEESADAWQVRMDTLGRGSVEAKGWLRIRAAAVRGEE